MKPGRYARLRGAAQRGNILAEFVKRGGTITVPELRSSLGLTPDLLRYHLRWLHRDGIILPVGTSETGDQPGRPPIQWALASVATQLQQTVYLEPLAVAV
jgi:predicted ArsR family transcriptional regulator